MYEIQTPAAATARTPSAGDTTEIVSPQDDTSPLDPAMPSVVYAGHRYRWAILALGFLAAAALSLTLWSLWLCR